MEREGKGRLWRALHRWPLHPVRWLRGGGRVSRLDLLAYRSYRREYWADGTKVGTQCAGGRYIHKHCCTFTYITYIKVHTNTQAWYTHTHTHARTQTHMCTHARTHHTHTHTPHSCPLWVCSYCAAELTELFKEHKFVGCVDQTRALVQFLVSCLFVSHCCPSICHYIVKCRCVHLNSSEWLGMT